jgi:hypothetical protein
MHPRPNRTDPYVKHYFTAFHGFRVRVVPSHLLDSYFTSSYDNENERGVSMTDLEQLTERLKALPRRQYAELIRKVDAERRKVVEQQESNNPPAPGMSKESFVEWIVRHHFAIDKGITKILYLPAGAPEKEVRLLEINELASIPENGTVEAFDFMPHIEGVDYALVVADVTPKQWDAIMQGKPLLPKGWRLDGHRAFEPDDR